MTAMSNEDFEKLPPLLSAGEVAKLFQVVPKTVTRWAKMGQLTAIKTPGGHNRFRKEDIRAFMEKQLAKSNRENNLPNLPDWWDS